MMSNLNLSTAISDSLDDGSAQFSKSSALSSRIANVLSSSLIDTETREALQFVDSWDIRNNAATRRRVRLDIQKEVIDANGAVIKDFGLVAEQLTRIGATIASLNKCIDDIKSHVSTASRDTLPVLDEATSLLSQRHDVETKQKVLNAFTRHFILSETESETLMSTDGGALDAEFFILFGRLKLIHRDCEVLLGSENQQLGLELMDQSTQYLNQAFQKLARWSQREFKALDLENPRMNASMRQALRLLAERPTLFQACLDSFSEMREKTLADSFYSALTGFGNGIGDQVAKPMEYYAHDPLRFIGDMLAWTHSAAVSEHEALEVLFVVEGEEMAKNLQPGFESEPWLHETDKFDGQKYLEELVNRDLSGVFHALRQRIDQIVKSDYNAVLAYKISNFIDFYCTTFKRLLGVHSLGLDTLTALRESALQHSRSILRQNAASLTGGVESVPDDLDVPVYLVDAVERLKELMRNFDTSFTSATSREETFKEILSEALDPVLKTCKQSASTVPMPLSAVFEINCLSFACQPLREYDFTVGRCVELEKLLHDVKSVLADYQHDHFLRSSGLDTLLKILTDVEDTEDGLKSVVLLPSLEEQALVSSAQALDDFLPSAILDAGDNLRLLKHPTIATDVTTEAAERFCEDFELLESRLVAIDRLVEEEAVEDDTKRYVPIKRLFPRTAGEVRILLS